MAYATELRSARQGFVADRIHAIVESFRKARIQNRVYKQTLTELRSLNTRELADLGISAAEIPHIAREAALMAA
ncbi:MAG: DUF1127 domain-containing protein [Maritimibacter sp.]|nr:DUF1127 domain-containing protein [Maritimibacter sp.]